MLVATKRSSHFVVTKVRFCRDKTFLCQRQNTSFVATEIILSRQNTSIMFVVTKDAFVATKMILVAVPANDTNPALKQLDPQFVRDYVKHVGPTHRW